MACNGGCGGSGSNHWGICEVHQLVDGDETTRWVFWCELCKATVCHDCKSKPLRRTAAAAIRLARQLNPFN